MLISPDPVKYGGEEKETLEGGFRFLVARCNAAETFDSGEEVFNAVSFPVVSPVIWRGSFRTLPFRDTGAIVGGTKKGSKCGAIVAFVGNNNGITDPGNDLRGNRNVIDVPGCDEQFQRPAMEIDQGVEFGVSSASTCPNSLTISRMKRRSTVLMNSYVRAVNEAQSPFCPLGEFVENPTPNSVLAPPAKAAIDSLPRSESTRQISPRVAAPENVEDPFEDLPQIALRSARVGPDSGTVHASINFLSLFQSFSDRPR